MIKDLRIDNKPQRVFILKENEERAIYIPLNMLMRVHYQQLLEISERAKDSMLEEMRTTTMPNGINALVQFDSLIQVFEKSKGNPDEGTRTRKPNEPVPVEEKVKEEAVAATPQPIIVQIQQSDIEAATTPTKKAPAKRKAPAKKATPTAKK